MSGHVTSDRKPFYQHVTSRDPTASRPQTLNSSLSMATSCAADAACPGSWSSFGGRTFPRRDAAAVQTTRRRVADVGQVLAAPPRSHSRSYSDLHSGSQLSPPPPPPQPLEPASILARTSSSSTVMPRPGPRRAAYSSWTLDRHRSTAPPADDVTQRQTGYPVCDV